MATRLDLIGIVTKDLAVSLAFYRELGLPIPDGNDDEPHVEVTIDNGLRIAWDPIETILGFDPEFELGQGRDGPIDIAFLCGSPAEVDETYARLSALTEGHREPFDAPWGQRYATVRDPDGNSIDLFAPLA